MCVCGSYFNEQTTFFQTKHAVFVRKNKRLLIFSFCLFISKETYKNMMMMKKNVIKTKTTTFPCVRVRVCAHCMIHLLLYHLLESIRMWFVVAVVNRCVISMLIFRLIETLQLWHWLSVNSFSHTHTHTLSLHLNHAFGNDAGRKKKKKSKNYWDIVKYNGKKFSIHVIHFDFGVFYITTHS